MALKRSGAISYYSFSNMEEWPSLTQAAFCRFGGVSQPPFASLNVSYAVGDQPEHVLANRQLAARAVGWDPARIVTAGQVHGRKVERVVREMAGGPDLPGTDALVTDEPGVLLMLKFADCVPIFLWDPMRRVVGLVHAGWRGTVQSTPAAAVEAMVEGYGCNPADMLAGIGPSIGPCCYQVGPEVEKLASHTFAGAGVIQHERDGDIRFDLWSANAETLMRCGVADERIARANLCTRCNSDLFFSHRASGGNAGRFAAVAGIRDE